MSAPARSPLSAAEVRTLSAYAAHDREHPGAVAWLEGGDERGARAALASLHAAGLLERGLFGLHRISRAGRAVVYGNAPAGRF